PDSLFVAHREPSHLPYMLWFHVPDCQDIVIRRIRTVSVRRRWPCGVVGPRPLLAPEDEFFVSRTLHRGGAGAVLDAKVPRAARASDSVLPLSLRTLGRRVRRTPPGRRSTPLAARTSDNGYAGTASAFGALRM